MKATIILPTTGDRGPILKYSVGSVLKQTETNWELFIIGDGASDETRSMAEGLVQSDPRIYYFDFPKDESRGELNRHRLITEQAKGEIICYLCDRDLYLPHHIELLYRTLLRCDFTHSQMVTLKEEGLKLSSNALLRHKTQEERVRAVQSEEMFRVPLSFVGHRRDAYMKLPYGWRVTPNGLWTDSYMWQQFCAQEWIRAAMVYYPTVIYLKRGHHPGLSTAERVKESRRCSEQYLHPEGVAEFQYEVSRLLLKKIQYDAFNRKRFRRMWKAFRQRFKKKHQ